MTRHQFFPACPTFVNTVYDDGEFRPRGGTWVNFCWIGAAGFLEPLPHYRGACENSRLHVRSLGGKQSRPFLASTFANYLALIFRRLGGEGRVEAEENGQNSESVVLRPAAEFASLVVLLCTGRGCQFQATENATKSQITTLKTYGKISLFIF